MAHEHQERLNRSKIRLTHLVSFFYGFSQAMVIYVLSSYFKLVSGTENVGVFYFVAYSIVLVAILNLHKLVGALGKPNILYFSILANIIFMFTLIMLPFSWVGVGLLMLYIIFSMLVFVSLDMILESFSVDRMSGRIRGFHLTVINLGFLAGPFLSTRILDMFDFRGIFICLLVIDSLMFILSLSGMRKINHHFSAKLTVPDLLRKVMKRKDVMKVYSISFGLEFFYALMVIYTPLYLRDLGFSWAQIGVIFTVMLVPFVLFQYLVGRIADKHWGEKELIIASLFIIGISTLAIYLIQSASLIIWSIMLFATRIGASLIEVLRDSYFYKRIGGVDVDIINFFRTATPVAYIFGSILSAAMLFFLPLKAIFILVALVVFSALYPAFYLQDNKSEAEIK